MSGTAAEDKLPGSRAPNGPLLVADSFRVRPHPRTGAAEVRGWERHAARFTRSALEFLSGVERRAAVPQERIAAFLDETRGRIAEYGEGFPRLELRGSAEPGGEPEFGLSLRPLPELGETIALRSAHGIHLDRPEHKGPNLARLMALNRELGAEAMLLDDDGRAVEGATTSLIWWTDGTDASGHVVGEQSGTPVARVASVTESLISEAAQRGLAGRTALRYHDGELSLRRPTLAELQSSEVWAVNALHGIRLVTRIDDTPLAAPHADRLRWFRDALERSWQPLLS